MGYIPGMSHLVPLRRDRLARLLAAALASATLLLGAAACGDDEGETSRAVSATEHNDADVDFAARMLQHHAQALSMVDLTRERQLDPEVQRLAEQIRTAQAPEIETFGDWLTTWGEEVPATMRDHAHAGHGGGDVSDSMAGMDHGDMPGSMSEDDFASLEDASDAEFQDRWLELMVAHHEGAVEMARTEQDEGRYRPAIELAASIAESQAAEVETMRGLLAE